MYFDILLYVLIALCVWLVIYAKRTGTDKSIILPVIVGSVLIMLVSIVFLYVPNLETFKLELRQCDYDIVEAERTEALETLDGIEQLTKESLYYACDRLNMEISDLKISKRVDGNICYVNTEYVYVKSVVGLVKSKVLYTAEDVYSINEDNTLDFITMSCNDDLVLFGLFKGLY